jgi:hypothetical protein
LPISLSTRPRHMGATTAVLSLLGGTSIIELVRRSAIRGQTPGGKIYTARSDEMGRSLCLATRARTTLANSLPASHAAVQRTAESPAEQKPKTSPRPGSADAWIEELFPNEAWRLLKPPRIHRAIEQKIETRNAELVREAKSRNEKATLLEHVSLTAVRDALKRRPER